MPIPSLPPLLGDHVQAAPAPPPDPGEFQGPETTFSWRKLLREAKAPVDSDDIRIPQLPMRRRNG